MSNNTQNIIAWIIGISFVILITYSLVTRKDSVKRQEKKVTLLLNMSNFSIGKLSANYYTNAAPGGYSYLIDIGFKFNFENEDFLCKQNATETDFLTPDISESHFKANKPFTIGEKYLVLVDSKYPQKSVICLDKPIHDSIDFKRYVKEFEEMRSKK